MGGTVRFEGEVVDGGNQIVIRQFKGDIDIPLLLDETVQLVFTAKVTEVSHQVNQRNGTVSRTHVVHVQEVRKV